MAKQARTPRMTKTKRSEESTALEALWGQNRTRSRGRTKEEASLGDGYRYILTIQAVLGPEFELFSEVLFSLQVLGLDKTDWRHRLEEHARIGGGSTQDNFAFAMMQTLVDRRGIRNVKRAAELAVANMGLYPDAASFHSAVTRCRNVWQRYKAGTFQPKGDAVAVGGLFVRPRRDNLREYEVRNILDPSDLSFLPERGKLVSDTVYWRRLAELGFVEIVQRV